MNNEDMDYARRVVPMEWPTVTVVLARRGRARSEIRDLALWSVRLGLRLNDVVIVLERVSDEQFDGFARTTEQCDALAFVVRRPREFRRAVLRGMAFLDVICKPLQGNVAT